MRGFSIPWFVSWCILVFAICFSPAGAQKTGFVSISCGYVGPSYTDINGIVWQQDSYYPPGGQLQLIYQTPVGFPPTKSLIQLRFFPQGDRNCYKIPVIKPGRYLVRLTFWYMNYDGLNLAPKFNVSIGISDSGQVQLDIGDVSPVEYIVTVTEAEISICLIRVAHSPIINSIEIRPLPYDSYVAGQIPWNVQKLLHRFNCGGAPDVYYRYPDDPYDRRWVPDLSKDFYAIDDVIASEGGSLSANTTQPILHALSSPYYVPGFVLQAERTPSLPSTDLIYNFSNVAYPNVGYQLYLYFAEISASPVPPLQRLFSVFFNDELVVSDLDVVTLAGGQFALHAASYPLRQSTSTISIRLSASKTAPLPFPIISGIEIYQLYYSPVPTDTQEVNALQAFRAKLGNPAALEGWVGDPCSPQAPWVGVTCQLGNQLTFVTQLSLIGANLTGSLTSAVASLSHLTLLNLGNNALVGAIPQELGNLRHLHYLYLRNNGLTGPIPASLATLTSLSVIDLRNNKLSGIIPFPTSLALSEKIMLAGNPELCDSNGVFGLPTCPSSAPLPPPPSPPLISAGRFPSNQPPQPAASFAEPPPDIATQPSPAPRSRESSIVVAGAVVAAMLLAAALIAIMVLYLLRAKRRSSVVGMDMSAVDASRLGALTKVYSVGELAKATGGFSLANQIGVGGFGQVYRGVLGGGEVVAVKKRAGDSAQGSAEFKNEIAVLSRVHHKHLVKLLGCCSEKGQQILVYQYMANGTVREHLYDKEGRYMGKLSWQQRLAIALGAAKGLEYLHTGIQPSIIHRDVKSSNILVDGDWEAKVADFGLSTSGPAIGLSHVSTMIRGTPGYLDPDYLSTKRLTEKSDVYGFGVVLLELVCGREPIDERRGPDASLIEWSRRHLASGDVQGVVDPTMGEYQISAMWKVAELAILCAEPKAMYRPDMALIVQEISEAMELELNGGVAMMVAPYGGQECREGDDGYYGEETHVFEDRM